MFESRREILERTGAFRQCAEAVLQNQTAVCNFFDRPGDIVLLACGSSYWASLSAHKTLARVMNRRTYAVKAGDILMNPADYRHAYDRPLLILPSRSGNTTEQLEAVRILRTAYPDAPALSIVVYDDSPLEGISDVSIRIPWANEISVCQTRSFSCLYLSMIMIAGLYDEALQYGMLRFLDASEELAQRDFRRVEAMAEENAARTQLIALGSGVQYGVAVEGAYISIEMAQMTAEYYHVMELRHGPIVTVSDATLIALCSMGEPRAFEESAVREAARYGACTLAVVKNGGFAGADYVFSLGGEYPPEAVALHYAFIMQAFAYFTAVARGLDPDNPGDLVRYIQI